MNALGWELELLEPGTSGTFDVNFGNGLRNMARVAEVAISGTA